MQKNYLTKRRQVQARERARRLQSWQHGAGREARSEGHGPIFETDGAFALKYQKAVLHQPGARRNETPSRDEGAETGRQMGTGSSPGERSAVTRAASGRDQTAPRVRVARGTRRGDGAGWDGASVARPHRRGANRRRRESRVRGRDAPGARPHRRGATGRRRQRGRRVGGRSCAEGPPPQARRRKAVARAPSRQRRQRQDQDRMQKNFLI